MTQGRSDSSYPDPSTAPLMVKTQWRSHTQPDRAQMPNVRDKKVSFGFLKHTVE